MARLRNVFPAIISVCVIGLLCFSSAFAADTPAKIKGLYVTGGCCHDYVKQIAIVTEGLSQRISIDWDVVSDKTGEIFQKKDWAKGYDIVVHNQCHAKIKDKKTIENAVAPHRDKGIPAVFIHCALHTCRDAKESDEWRKLIGVTSRRHEKGGRTIDVKPVAKDNPIIKEIPKAWTINKCELYVIEKQWPKCKPLVTGYGRDTKKDYPVLWTNEYGKAKVFGNSLGHTNETMMTDEYLDSLARGVLWCVGKLEKDGSTPDGYQGTGKKPFSFEGKIDPTKQPTPAK